MGNAGYRAGFFTGLRAAPAGAGAGLLLSRLGKGRGPSVLFRGTRGAGYDLARFHTPFDPDEEMVVMVFRSRA